MYFSLNKVSKPTLYFILLTIILIFFEIIFCSFSNIFSSTTDRIKLKSAMFDYRNKTEILCLGSSRFKAAISPKLLCKNIKDETNIEWKGFNGAITGANIERLEYFFNKAIVKKGLKYIILEISAPQLNRKKIDIESSEKEEDIETKIVNVLQEKSSLIAYRKAIRLDNLKNIPAIIFSDYLQGSELYKKGALSDLAIKGDTDVTDKQLLLWEPTFYTPNYNSKEIITKDDILFNTFKKISKTAKDHNVELLLVIPPLVNDAQKKETTLIAKQRYQKLANIMGHKIYDYSTKNIPELYFRDKHSHFNKKGKFLFSSLLAKLMIKKYNLNHY